VAVPGQILEHAGDAKVDLLAFAQLGQRAADGARRAEQAHRFGAGEHDAVRALQCRPGIAGQERHLNDAEEARIGGIALLDLDRLAILEQDGLIALELGDRLASASETGRVTPCIRRSAPVVGSVPNVCTWKTRSASGSQRS
jgi:hypothetical protein